MNEVAEAFRSRRRMRSRGFTLVELLVALVISGTVAAVSYDLLLDHVRLSRWQLERAQLDQTLHAARAIPPADLRSLDAQDPAGGDLLAVSDTAVAYNAMRGLYVVCRAPTVVSETSGTVVVALSPAYAPRPPAPGQDSALVLTRSDTTAADLWAHAGIASVTPATCADSSPGLALDLGGVTPRGGLAGVSRGAPVRTTQSVRLRGYRDPEGDWWIGVTEHQAGGRWSATQPLLGPIVPRGLRIGCYDSAGRETGDPSRVARIAITIVARSTAPVRAPGGDVGYLTDSVTAEVALRGNTPR